MNLCHKLYHMDLYIFELHMIYPTDNLDSKHIRAGIQSMDYHNIHFYIHKLKHHLVRHNLKVKIKIINY